MIAIYTQDTLKDLAGEILKDADGKPVTYGKIFVNALLNSLPDDTHISGEEKLKRFRLAKRLFSEETSNLEAEEVVMLQKLLPKNYGVLVTGQILDWLK